MKYKASIFNFTGFLLAAVVLASAAFTESASAKNVVINPGKTVNGLRMEAHVHLIGGQGEKQLVIHAVLINEGSNNVTVLTKELGPSLGSDASGFAADFSFTGEQHMDGRVMIPSLYPRDPVTLRPGEATMLFTRTGNMAKAYVELLKKSDKIRVGYDVSDKWGKQFDIWHGYVCANASIE